MTCPKCKSEQPDSAKFCSQCAGPLIESNQKIVVKSNVPAWLAVVLLLALAFIGIAVWNMMQQNQRLRNNTRNIAASAGGVIEAPRPQPRFINLTNGAATVNAGSYLWYTFVVPPGANSVAVNGHFSATGGAGNDVECYILDEDGFANFKNGHPTGTYYSSGKVTQAKIGTTNLAPGTYYLVFDNRFSLITPKAVQTQATVTYMQ
jgi:hypothetical protein